MRYICQKEIVVKIFDGILEDKDEILNLLNNLKEKETTCSIQVKSAPIYEYVRILEVHKDSFTWRLIKNRVTLKKTSPISDLNSLLVTTDDEMSLRLKPNPSRWSTLDTSGSL